MVPSHSSHYLCLVKVSQSICVLVSCVYDFFFHSWCMFFCCCCSNVNIYWRSYQQSKSYNHNLRSNDAELYVCKNNMNTICHKQNRINMKWKIKKNTHKPNEREIALNHVWQIAHENLFQKPSSVFSFIRSVKSISLKKRMLEFLFLSLFSALFLLKIHIKSGLYKLDFFLSEFYRNVDEKKKYIYINSNFKFQAI